MKKYNPQLLPMKKEIDLETFFQILQLLCVIPHTKNILLDPRDQEILAGLHGKDTPQYFAAIGRKQIYNATLLLRQGALPKEILDLEVNFNTCQDATLSIHPDLINQ